MREEAPRLRIEEQQANIDGADVLRGPAHNVHLTPELHRTQIVDVRAQLTSHLQEIGANQVAGYIRHLGTMIGEIIEGYGGSEG